VIVDEELLALTNVGLTGDVLGELQVIFPV
jgi:hypothetical protein